MDVAKRRILFDPLIRGPRTPYEGVATPSTGVATLLYGGRDPLTYTKMVDLDDGVVLKALGLADEVVHHDSDHLHHCDDERPAVRVWGLEFTTQEGQKLATPYNEGRR